MELKALIKQIQKQYREDTYPWVIGFSGGKDSTATLQLVFQAILKLPVEQRHKPIHVISNDTLVENPAVQKFIDEQLAKIAKAGKEILFPHNPTFFVVKKTTPKIEDTFWVNLLVNGYPAPNRWFRWCTQRMKINPTTQYIKGHRLLSKGAILVLGTRKAESTVRAKSMERFENENGSLLRNYSISNTWVYPPIASWSNDDVWTYLLQVPNFWGGDNKKLLTLYRNASGECPIVVETGTASCGNSRFGCWVCTVVKRDKSMENLIENGEEWMEELLEFRNWLVDIRDYEAMTNKYKEYYSGPLLLKTRKEIFEKLINLEEITNRQLISDKERTYINEAIEHDESSFIEDGLYQFDITTKNNKELIVISDYNILNSQRKRIGSVHLDEAKVTKQKRISRTEYTTLKDMTRVLFNQPN